MKKIIFVAQSLRIGGAQRALVNQVNDLCKSGNEVSLFLYSASGEYLNMLNKNIKIIKSNFLLNCLGKTFKESQKNIIIFVVRNIASLMAKYIGSSNLFGFIFKFSPKLKDYDVAISYLHNIDNKSLYFGYNKFVLDNIEAHKKIAWIHSDYEVAKLNNEINRKEYQKMDHVINVSNNMKLKFEKITNIRGDKSKVVYNILPIEEIERLALEYRPNLDYKMFNIVTLSRLDDNKSIIELCKVAKVLNNKNQNFIWHFIGNGPLYDKCKQFIHDNSLKEKVILHGFLSNPYPILKGANLFVSGSKSETFGMSIAESLVLNIPVIALRYSAIDEIIDGNGIVVENFDDMAIQIQELLKNKESYNNIKLKAKLLRDYNFQNRSEIKKILNEG